MHEASRIILEKRKKETDARINADTQDSEHAFFKYLCRNSAAPSAAIKDPTNGNYVFDMQAQHEIMVQQWKTVFDRHKDAPPSWTVFLEKYGKYHPKFEACGAKPPGSNELWKRAQRAKAAARRGSRSS